MLEFVVFWIGVGWLRGYEFWVEGSELLEVWIE